MAKRFWVILLVFSIGINVHGQVGKERDYVFPVRIPVLLSGTFGELRTAHFHAGIDIRTESKVGKVIVAIQDGFVSRIKVSATGYGKAIYLEHPDGYTSVYGHLWHFTPELDAYVKDVQYSRRSFEADIYPDAGRFAFKKGDTIAWSGNTGSSGGPHLHFELRETALQVPVNPLLNGFPIDDKTPPLINLIRIYPADSSSAINGSNAELTAYTKSAGTGYKPSFNNPCRISGDVYFGINTWDPFNNYQNRNGVYSIEYYLDSALYFRQVFDKVPFDETRYINSLIDYAEFRSRKTSIQKTLIQPGNRLSIYDKTTDQGIFHFQDSLEHNLLVKVADANGNVSVLSFDIQSIPPDFAGALAGRSGPSTGLTVFSYDAPNSLDTTGFRFTTPEDALYEDISVNYEVLPGQKGMLSPVHCIHNDLVPVHKYCRLMIRPDSIPERYKDKAIIVKLTDSGPEAFTSEWENGYLCCDTREFGNYSVMADTVKPVVAPLFRSGTKVTEGDTLFFKAEDMLSGIGSYSATLNGQWALLEYDAKNDLLFYVADDHLAQGTNTLLITVDDRVRNRTKLEVSAVLE